MTVSTISEQHISMPDGSVQSYSLTITETLRGSSKAIIAISPWKSLLATSSEDGSVKIWDTTRLKAIHGFLPSCFLGSPVTSILWRNDKTLLVTADTSLYTLTIPDEASTILVHKATLSHNVAMDEINDLIHLDKSKVVMADDAGRIYFFDTIKHQVTNTLSHGEIISSLAVLRDGNNGATLVSGALDCHIKLWDVKSARVIHDIDASSLAGRDESLGAGLINPPYVHSLCTDGKRTLVAGLGDGGILCARLQGFGKKRQWVVKYLHNHGIAVGALAALSDPRAPSSLFISGSNDKTCKLWSIEALFQGSEKPLASVQMPAKINAIAALDDGRVAVGDVLGNLSILTIQQSVSKRNNTDKDED